LTLADYDNVPMDIIALSREADIDHIVPLKEAWEAGAHAWTADRRKEFANDLLRPQLLTVTVSAFSRAQRL